jgi:hypothetical protein
MDHALLIDVSGGWAAPFPNAIFPLAAMWSTLPSKTTVKYRVQISAIAVRVL